ncbi:MAG: class I SAM-dependent methyltransferase [Flavisolibacter sp.]|jgi:hypothetical protein|nr:class I SAM-dependent methyltransferase [Flavisolibacter sp.]
MRNLLRRIYFAFKPSGRLVLMDYAIAPEPVYTCEQPHRQLFQILSENTPDYRELLQEVLPIKEKIFEIKDASVEKDPLMPSWNNGYVPGLDIIILYALLKKLKPKKYIEIGSGTTTKTAYKSRKDFGLDFSITCIDPNPRQEIKEIADHWEQSLLQKAPLQLFSSLEAGDIVFFDGTHTLYPNSDVMWFFLEVLPVLPKGVVVQVHDIYIPYDYPQFMLDKYYSESYLLAALVLNNPDRFEIIAPNYFISQQPALAQILQPIWNHHPMQNVEQHGGSFWFRLR